ncbi:MAG: hypothetical protein ACN4GW_09875 [Desulforhopalus sp.]
MASVGIFGSYAGLRVIGEALIFISSFFSTSLSNIKEETIAGFKKIVPPTLHNDSGFLNKRLSKFYLTGKRDCIVSRQGLRLMSMSFRHFGVL